jgi:hypothetical protein
MRAQIHEEVTEYRKCDPTQQRPERDLPPGRLFQKLNEIASLIFERTKKSENRLAAWFNPLTHYSKRRICSVNKNL